MRTLLMITDTVHVPLYLKRVFCGPHPAHSEAWLCWPEQHYMQVSVYPADHVKAQGFQLQRQPDSRASKRLEKWKGVPRKSSS